MIETHRVTGPITGPTPWIFGSQMYSPRVSEDYDVSVVVVVSMDTVNGVCVADVTADTTVFDALNADPEYTVT